MSDYLARLIARTRGAATAPAVRPIVPTVFETPQRDPHGDERSLASDATMEAVDRAPNLSPVLAGATPVVSTELQLPTSAHADSQNETRRSPAAPREGVKVESSVVALRTSREEFASAPPSETSVSASPDGTLAAAAPPSPRRTSVDPPSVSNSSRREMLDERPTSVRVEARVKEIEKPASRVTAEAAPTAQQPVVVSRAEPSVTPLLRPLVDIDARPTAAIDDERTRTLPATPGVRPPDGLSLEAAIATEPLRDAHRSIEITIGRIEVTAAQPTRRDDRPRRAPSSPPAPAPRLSLEEYLRRRAGKGPSGTGR